MQTSLLEVILRTAAIYGTLYVSLRLLGKREVSQFTPFDLILLLTLSNAVQNAMVGDNTTLGAGILAAMTLLVLNFFWRGCSRGIWACGIGWRAFPPFWCAMARWNGGR